jgi:hypothetical protein
MNVDSNAPPSATGFEEVDLFDFSDPENGEIISDLGLEHLIRRARAYSSEEWEFKFCERDRSLPYVFVLGFASKR